MIQQMKICICSNLKKLLLCSFVYETHIQDELGHISYVFFLEYSSDSDNCICHLENTLRDMVRSKLADGTGR